MFDANKGNQKIADQVDERTDEFAALFGDLSPRKQLTIISKMNELLADTDATDAFAAGNLGAPNSAPAAIGSGSGTSAPAQQITAQDALQVIMADPNVDDGIKAALRRILIPTDPEHIAVGRDGTPSELVSTRQERENAKTAQKAAEDKLAEEKDENKSGSLAHQLKHAKATPPVAADSVKKTDVKAKVDELSTAVDDLAAPMGAKVKGKTEVKAKVDELKQMVS
jgi:hypothetical protein